MVEFSGPRHSRSLLPQPVSSLGVLSLPEGAGVGQEAQRRPFGHSRVRGAAEEAGPYRGRDHAVHR